MGSFFRLLYVRSSLPIIFLLLCTFPGLLIAQDRGEILIGDEYSLGVIKYAYGSPHHIKYSLSPLNFRENAITYSAGQVTEFYIAGTDTRFLSRKVAEYDQPVFLEIVSEGRISLLRVMGRKELYVMENEVPSLLDKSNYQTLLARSSGCEGAGFPAMNFSSNEIIYFVRELNKTGECKTPPRVTFGLSTGYSLARVAVRENSSFALEFGDYDLSSSTLAAGISLEVPFWAHDHFSLHSEIQFHQLRLNDSFSEDKKDMGVKIHRKHLALITSLKYTFSSGTVRPYVLLGPVLEYGKTDKSEFLYARVGTDGEITFSEGVGWFDPSPISVGHSAGAGILLGLIERHPVMLEVQHRRVYNSDKITSSAVSFLIKLSL